MKPTHAMVLAAGLGTRMAPLSRLLAKPALPVLNKPIIAHTLNHLAAHGVTHAVVNTHARPESIREAVEAWCPEGVSVEFSHEPEILGTAGGLRRAARGFPDAPIYMVNSDSLCDADLAAAAAAHAASGRRATMIVRPHEEGSPYNPVIVADDGTCGRLLGFGAAAGNRAAGVPRTFIGVHIIEPDVIASIPEGRACDINADIYTGLLEEDSDTVGTWLHDGWWFEAGNPSRYLDLNLAMILRAGCTSVVGPGFFIDEDARVTASAVGAGARLERDVVVDRSVLWENVTGLPGVQVSRCIVTGGVVLPAGGAFEESIIMPAEGEGCVVTPLDSPAGAR